MEIITLRSDSKKLKEYRHLFEISQLPSAFSENPKLDWRVRDGFEHAGSLLVGDLRVLKQETDVVEIHPFPEWLVEILQPFSKVGTAYAIVPNWPVHLVDSIKKLPWDQKLSIIKKELLNRKSEHWIAIQYEPGICIKICEYVPHEFLAYYSEDQIPPYLQCFEPNFDFLPKVMGIEATILFPLEIVLKF